MKTHNQVTLELYEACKAVDALKFGEDGEILNASAFVQAIKKVKNAIVTADSTPSHIPTEGTPETLLQAIINGFGFKAVTLPHRLEHEIQDHVRDFLAQNFGSSLLENGDDKTCGVIQKLWTRITGEKII